VRTAIKDGKPVPRDHHGWDIPAPVGTPAYPITDGSVVYASDVDDEGYGKPVILRFIHQGEILYALYAHLDELTIPVVGHGDKPVPVTVKDQLGKTGRTGNAKKVPVSEAHLHFEIRNRAWLPPKSGFKHRVNPIRVLGVRPVLEAFVSDVMKMFAEPPPPKRPKAK
jgi:murein DD-endopeptidase MepM/ murein hydrolase activator NlpD